MKKPSFTKSLFAFLLFFCPYYLFSQNDACGSAPTIGSAVSPGTSTGGSLLVAAGYTTISGLPVGCNATNDDVWYKFVAQTTHPTITYTAGTLTNGAIQLFSGSCAGTLTSIACGTSLTPALTVGTTYLIRIYSTTNATGTFTINITDPRPVNDDCANATLLTNEVTNSAGTVWLATASPGIPVGCATGNPDDDVWYKFIPSTSNATVSLVSTASGLLTSGAMIQVFSGTSCGSLASIACGTPIVYLTGLTASNTYYIRVYSFGTGALASGANSLFSIFAGSANPAAGRMNEVFKETIISGINALNTPWEVTYGPDNYLWVTESKGYKAYRINPSTGAKTTILDLSNSGIDFPSYNVGFTSAQSPWPQGGFAGLAIHPQFNSGKPYVYISYVKTYVGGSSGPGYFFTNSLVRFTYNTGTGKLESPVTICDTLPGSSDHNSQRIIIAPVGGTDYLFYAQGDMGAGQLANANRTNKAQTLASYEGKILRFNLEQDADVSSAFDKWIPNDNPYNGANQTAVWCAGIRNNQGFAYDTTLGILYGASHGPYSDDEVNIIERDQNYGHPYVIGKAADGNYNNSSAGVPNGGSSTLAVITDEVAAAAAIPNYKDPLFTGYATDQATIHNIWVNNPNNGTWPSEAWSGMDIYKSNYIPGWKNSLVLCGLKWGRVLRLKLGPAGNTIALTNGADTVAYFQGNNRYRDLAFAPNGKDIYVSMESSTTAGPAAGTPLVPVCTNCIVKFSFLGYKDIGGESSIPAAVDVTDGTVNTVDSATTVVIDDTNNNLWVPITGPDGNIMAEIYPNGNNLDTVRAAFYKHTGALRVKAGVKYLDRNMTITPNVQPSSPVKIRLYFSKAEYDALDLDATSGVNAITDLKILKNQDACGSAIASSTTLINPTFSEMHGTNGYMLQGDISSFSSFYFASSNIALPLHLLNFKGSLQNDATLLDWETTSEVNTSQFIVERSINGQNFDQIGTVASAGNSSVNNKYSFTDYDATHQSSSILYYRLKMVDIDGTYTYSDVVTISLPLITAKVSVFPNPAFNEVKVTIISPADGKIRWSLIDNTGRVVIQNSDELRKGNNNLSIDIDNLSTGFYYLSVSGAGIDQKVKLEKL